MPTATSPTTCWPSPSANSAQNQRGRLPPAAAPHSWWTCPQTAPATPARLHDMTPARVALNLYLLKPGVGPAAATPSLAAAAVPTPPPDHLVHDGGGVGWTRAFVLGDEPTDGEVPVQMSDAPLLIVRSVPASGGWLDAVVGLVPEIALGDARDYYGALLFQRVDGDTVLWSFGNAWSTINTVATIPRFGLLAGLNALLSTPAPVGSPPREVGVRGLTAAVRAAVVRRATLTATRPSSPTAMERVDHASDAAAMAELTTHHSTFGRITAGRSLRFDAPFTSVTELEQYAREAIRLYRRDDYTHDDGYKWIDYTVPVGDQTEIDNVLDELLAQANDTAAPLAVDMVWAEPDPHTDVAARYVCFPRERSGPGAAHRLDLTWPSARQWLAAHAAGQGGSEALRTNVRFYSDDDTRVHTIELWELLVAQLSLNGTTYIVSDGDVWRTSPTHIANIDALLATHAIINPPWLPRYLPGEVEGDYNQRAAAHGPHALLDKKLVNLPGHTTFEAGDLLSDDGRLMHIKRKTRSSAMSHLTTQAIVSTRLLRGELGARTAVTGALAALNPPPAALAAMQAHIDSFSGATTANVYLVIIGQWRGTPSIAQLPLLTRIGLNSWLRDMPTPRAIVLVGT